MRKACWLVPLIAAMAFAVSAVERDSEDDAEVHRIGRIRIVDPWAKSSIGGAHDVKLFFEFRNHGEAPDRLIDARSMLASGPTRFRVVLADDTGRQLREIEAIEIPASDQVFELSEVGYYIELSGLEVPVLMGKRFPVELTFERAGKVTVEFVARFHSPKLTRRIREAAARGDVEALKALRPPN